MTNNKYNIKRGHQILKPYQVWFVDVANNNVYEPEAYKFRPIIILEPYYTPDEFLNNDADLNTLYPDLAPGTSKIEKYEYEDNAIIITKEESKNLLNKDTVFRFSQATKNSNGGPHSITAYDIINFGKFKGYLPIEIQNKIYNNVHIPGMKLPKPYTKPIKVTNAINTNSKVTESVADNTLTNAQKEFFKNSKVRDANGNLLVMYHGSVEVFNKFNSPINWFSSNKEYAYSYADWSNANAIHYEVYLNCKNIFDCGNTDGRVFKLFPIEPYKFTEEIIRIYTKLGLTEDEFRKVVNDISTKLEYTLDNFNKYAIKIYTLVRTPEFMELCRNKGYDSISTIEQGNYCIGVFNPNDIKSVGNISPTNTENIYENFNDEDAKFNDNMSILDALYILKDIN